MKYIVISLLLFTIAGCSTLDRVTGHPNICPVHGDEMTIKKLDLSPGYSGYVQEYYDKMKKEFPNYDGARWGHVDHIFGARWVNAYVCDSCNEAYKRYWSVKEDKNESK